LDREFVSDFSDEDLSDVEDDRFSSEEESQSDSDSEDEQPKKKKKRGNGSSL
jgi:hypothetical protein